MVYQAASQTRFRALKHEYGIDGEATIIVRVIACFQPLHFCQKSSNLPKISYKSTKTSTGLLFCWMVNADGSLPRPHHVAWQSPSSNYFSMLPKPSLLGLPTYLNSSTCIFPAVSTFDRLAAPSIPNLKSELTNEVQGFLQHHNADTSLKETCVGGALQNENPSLQKQLLIFDHSDNKTRLFYGPVVPLVQCPTVTATKFAQSYLDGEGQVNNVDQKHLANDSLLEESVKDHIVDEESEMHEDTEEINALLYSEDDSDDDDDSDEVTSTDRSPLATKSTYVIQEQFEDTKEKVASCDWPNKRLKLIDGDFNISSPPVNRSNLARSNETCDCVSDAESKNSSGWPYSVNKTIVDDSVVRDIKLKKDKIRESLRVLENLIPGAKGKEPLLVIDETIEYLKLLMSQSGALGVKYH